MLSDEDEFELFVHWIYKEFSSESILCFIELVQFRHYLISEMKKIYHQDIEQEYVFYANIPKSSIVHETAKGITTEQLKLPKPTEIIPSAGSLTVEASTEIETGKMEKNEYHVIARKLYAKYIVLHSEFQVNISHRLRTKYQEIDRNNWDMNANEMLNVFDPVIQNMFLFLRGSYSRFEEHCNNI